MVHTDLYKINLKSLSEGEHRFEYALDGAYFADIETDISAGEVDAKVVCIKRGETYRLSLELEGYVVGQCDRCLGELKLPVCLYREFVAKLGEGAREESDELLIVPEREGVLDLQWLLYEDIALSLPMQRMHEEDECDESMMKIYDKMLTEDVPEDDGDEAVERDADGIDPRWAALRQLREK